MVKGFYTLDKTMCMFELWYGGFKTLAVLGLLKKINKIYLLILEEEKKKTTFLFVFSTYLPLFLLKFRSG